MDSSNQPRLAQGFDPRTVLHLSSTINTYTRLASIRSQPSFLLSCWTLQNDQQQETAIYSDITALKHNSSKLNFTQAIKPFPSVARMADVLNPRRALHRSRPPHTSTIHLLPAPPPRKLLPPTVDLRPLLSQFQQPKDQDKMMEKSIPEIMNNIPTVSVDLPSGNGKVTTATTTIGHNEVMKEKTTKSRRTPILGVDFTQMGRRPRGASTHLVSLSRSRLFEDWEQGDSSATNLLASECCGGGCFSVWASDASTPGGSQPSTPPLPIFVPENAAFKSLRLKLSPLKSRNKLSGVTELPTQDRFIQSPSQAVSHDSTCSFHPPTFVQPHPPYSVYSAKLHAARKLTSEGAEKTTYHLEFDVTDYPEEIQGVDFRLGGAIGIVAPNNEVTVNEIFDRLRIPEAERDAPIYINTTGGRWPTIWGDEAPRSLLTTRRELLTWTVDIQSYAPKKQLLRVLAEYAQDKDEKTILLYLCSKQGQAAFCELRTGPYITLLQLLEAFPSSMPSFDALLSVLPNLMPRFYSMSCDPRSSHCNSRRFVAIAVTVVESPEGWRDGSRKGVASGFLQRKAEKFIAHQQSGSTEPLEIRIPMFRGLMASPLVKGFVVDGPMMLIGAGVGIAPFRGFVHRRLKHATCINKVWVLQGIRNSLVDELYHGEWGVGDEKFRVVVESRAGKCQYVQEEVRAQTDLVWYIINSLDGRIFVCGSNKGMGQGVEDALVDVAMQKAGLSRDEAKLFWKKKKEALQYISETW